MIAFKRHVSLDEWVNLSPPLRRILFDLDDASLLPLIVITRIYTPPVIGESGVHRTRPHRAADVRSNDLPVEKGEEIVVWLNDRYRYDQADSHKIALQHPLTGPDRHIHIQVSAAVGETRKRRTS